MFSRVPRAVLSSRRHLSTVPLVWSPSAIEPLNRVCDKVEESLVELKERRPHSNLWDEAFDAILSIAQSDNKHLLRPQLVLLGYACGKGQDDCDLLDERLINFAAGVEMHHLFMLVQDDSMDNGTTRRGVPTVNHALSRTERVQSADVTHLSTIVGDIIHSKSMSLLFENSCHANNSAAVNTILEGSYRAAGAQFDDIVGWDAYNSDEDTNALRPMLVDKAAFHGFVAPLVSGLQLSGYHDGCLEMCCRHWGDHFGVAFQGLDDIGDMLEDPLKTGKDSLQDIREGRLSLPLFILRQNADAQEWAFVRGMISGHSGPITYSERRELLQLFDKYELVNRTLDFVQNELKLADKVMCMCLDDPIQQKAESYEFLQSGLELFSKGLQERYQTFLPQAPESA